MTNQEEDTNDGGEHGEQGEEWRTALFEKHIDSETTDHGHERLSLKGPFMEAKAELREPRHQNGQFGQYVNVHLQGSGTHYNFQFPYRVRYLVPGTGMGGPWTLMAVGASGGHYHPTKFYGFYLPEGQGQPAERWVSDRHETGTTPIPDTQLVSWASDLDGVFWTDDDVRVYDGDDGGAE